MRHDIVASTHLKGSKKIVVQYTIIFLHVLTKACMSASAA